MEKEEILRRKVKCIMKYDLSAENPTEVSVPQKADCLFNVYVLDHVSVDEETYRRNLKAFSSTLKIGGVLMASGKFNSQFFTVG